MARIIPGVQVTVIKEVVPPQLAPSGVLGLVGLLAPPRAGIGRQQVERVGSWARFRELYGRASALAMPEAQQALLNGVFELVVVEVASTVATAAQATFSFQDSGWLTFTARARGSLSNSLALAITPQTFRGVIQGYELRVRDGSQDLEAHRNLSPFPGDARYIGKVLAEADSLVDITPPAFAIANLTAPVTLSTPDASQVLAAVGASNPLAVLTVRLNGAPSAPITIATTASNLRITRGSGAGAITLIDVNKSDPELITQVRDALAGEADIAVELRIPEISAIQTLSGGSDATVDEYSAALDLLENVPDVDLVAASVQDLTVARAAAIYGRIIAHCETMSGEAKGRLGFGQTPVSATQEEHEDLVSSLRSDRFVMLAPHGALGAVVGRIGSLSYYQSPTFKSLAGLGPLESALRVEQQRSYLRANIVPIAEVPERGIAIIRGITTDGDQINVRRIADRAVRGVKQIGELFIGKLNTESGRNALKQKLNEFLLQMQAENAIVPSTDGSDPAFKLAVYSSQADFAQGIVRVDLAVRPVRAIDYIYATVLVQV